MLKFVDSGTFAQEIIPVLRRKNRASQLTTLNLILTQISKSIFIIGTWVSIKIQCQYINLFWLPHNLVKYVSFFLFLITVIKFHPRKKTPAGSSSNNSNSPRFTQLNSQFTGLNSGKLEICKEDQASCEWTEYDDFPSSEDLSAILADLELDTINKTKEQSQPIINSKISTRPKPCVTSEEKTPC